MAKSKSASVVALHQPRPLTGAERTRNYRLRKAAEAVTVTSPAPIVTSPPASHRSLASYVLMAAGLGLTGTGICMNGWFSGSLGSTDSSKLVFLAVGIAADLIACALPTRAASLWARHRITSLTGWAIWVAVFAFVLMNGIGFAGTNISDVTLARQDRVTPAVTVAQVALNDAKAARDRECKGGIGKFCREREAFVVVRQSALDEAKTTVQKTGDPQVEAETRMVAWVSAGMLKPSSDDAMMLRLVLLALLPQIGGILLMIGRAK